MCAWPEPYELHSNCSPNGPGPSLPRLRPALHSSAVLGSRRREEPSPDGSDLNRQLMPRARQLPAGGARRQPGQVVSQPGETQPGLGDSGPRQCP